MYKYETHVHTSPVSRCAKASVADTVKFYKEKGYDGIFITNHFIGGNINSAWDTPYEEKIKFFASDYEEAKKIGDEIGIKVFFGLEDGYKGSDFLVFGLTPEWLLEHPEIADMKFSEKLTRYAEGGGLIVHAHPFREASYIDHIRLFPRHVHGVEVINASRNEFENRMALEYANNYGLGHLAGSDNHSGSACRKLGGVQTKTPVTDAQDFIAKFYAGELEIFSEIIEKTDN